MQLKQIKVLLTEFPLTVQSYLSDATIYDSSSSPEARVYFSDKDAGYFIKVAPKGELSKEADMMRFFHANGLSAAVLEYLTFNQKDYLVTQKIAGHDGIHQPFQMQPEKLVAVFAKSLLSLHKQSIVACPVQHQTTHFLERVQKNIENNHYELDLFKGMFDFSDIKEVRQLIKLAPEVLAEDTLVHGDYCLPNILLDNWQFSGFIDLGNAGVGDKHLDILWGIWTLNFNLGTPDYTDLFLETYGKADIDMAKLRLLAACEIFGA